MSLTPLLSSMRFYVQHSIKENINSEKTQRKPPITLMIGNVRCDVSVTDKQEPDWYTIFGDLD